MHEVLLDLTFVPAGCRRSCIGAASQRDRYSLQHHLPSAFNLHLNGTQLRCIPGNLHHLEAYVAFPGPRFSSNRNPSVDFPVSIRNMHRLGSDWHFSSEAQDSVARRRPLVTISLSVFARLCVCPMVPHFEQCSSILDTPGHHRRLSRNITDRHSNYATIRGRSSLATHRHEAS